MGRKREPTPVDRALYTEHVETSKGVSRRGCARLPLLVLDVELPCPPRGKADPDPGIRGLLSLGGAGALQRMENGADTAPHGDAARPRMSLLSAKRKHQSVEPKAKTQRWRTSQQAEDYMSLVADMMAPSVTFGAYGYDHEQVPRIVAPATQPRAITAA